MRTDPRYQRVRKLVMTEAPNDERGNILLCHHCQRALYFAGGMTTLLVRDLEREIVRFHRRRDTDAA